MSKHKAYAITEAATSPCEFALLGELAVQLQAHAQGPTALCYRGGDIGASWIRTVLMLAASLRASRTPGALCDKWQ